MPKKACCCIQPAPEENSCCRPIYQDCVGKTYTFEVLFKAKYPCFKNNPNGTFSDAEYRCQNNGSLHSIPGNAETFILTIEYKIVKPANLYFYPAYNKDGFDSENIDDYFQRNCGINYGCLQDRPDLNNPSTWKSRTYIIPGNGTFGNGDTIYSCIGCDCYTDPDYSTCNFSENDLNSTCTCDTGQKYWVYQCYNLGGTPTEVKTTNAPATSGDAICGKDPFSGQAYPYTLLSEGAYATKLWNQCYSYWRLQRPDKNFEPKNQNPPNVDCYSGCTFEPGDVNISNIPDSYSFQFIPDPNIPEQNSGNYVPRLQPDLLNFNVKCNWGDFLTSLPNKGYNIILDLGVGYKASFNCGGGSTEILDIPFQRINDGFATVPYNDGLYVRQQYRRSSLTNDPMNSCVPKTTYNYPYTSSSCINSVIPYYSSFPITRCYDPQTNLPSTLYKDEWNDCLYGPPIPYSGSTDYGLFTFSNDVKMKNVCDSGFIETQWNNVCEYFNLTADIIVDSN